MTDNWIKCPICGEPDMCAEQEDEGQIITCTNLCCASNGGDNWSDLKKRIKIDLTCKKKNF